MKASERQVGKGHLVAHYSAPDISGPPCRGALPGQETSSITIFSFNAPQSRKQIVANLVVVNAFTLPSCNGYCK